jgi:type IV secretory pathway component VirB8
MTKGTEHIAPLLFHSFCSKEQTIATEQSIQNPIGLKVAEYCAFF